MTRRRRVAGPSLPGDDYDDDHVDDDNDDGDVDRVEDGDQRVYLR